MKSKKFFQGPIYIVGPTGVGKSSVAMALSQMIQGEIIVADSMQVYRGLDIGTDKPTIQDRNKVLHHLLDIIEPQEAFDVSRFIQLARSALMDVQKRSKIPLVVGGTGLYVKALIDGLFEGPGRNLEIRRRLELESNELGIEPLYHRLKKIDPMAAQKIDSKNKRRIIRALEIYEMTGKPISCFQSQWENLKQDVCMIGLERGRQDLYQKIDQRVDQMFEKGLINEVRVLLEQGIEKNPIVMQAIGYKEVVDHLKKGSTIKEVSDQIKLNSRHLAKRQLTWFKKDLRIHWFSFGIEEPSLDMAEKIYRFLTSLGEPLDLKVGS